jgi:peptidoglycan/LPS O-acetylase OafA/YrhL
MERASIEHRTDIDGLRAFAVGIVVAFHASFLLFDGGFIGVDIFFVISGFLITRVLLQEIDDHGTIRLGRFWARRIRRLLPASTLMVLATMGATALLLSPISWRAAGEAGTWAAAYGQNVFLAVEDADYFTVGAQNPFVHFWSLAVEEQFYVVWPILMVGLSTIARRYQRPHLLTGGLVILAAASFVHSIQLTNDGSVWAYYSPLSRGWEFAAGGLLAIASPTIARHIKASAVSVATVAGIALVTYSLVTLNSATPFPGWRAVPPVLGTLLLLAANNGPNTLVARLLALAPVQWLGHVSYGWYLWHFPFLIIAEQHSTSFGPGRRLIAVMAALGVAGISYHLVENPVRFSARLRNSHPKNYALAAALLAVSVAAAATLVLAADDRLDNPRFVELQTAAEDFERISDQGCPEGASVDAIATSCVWGDPNGQSTLLVLGDSHADQWIPALDKIGVDNQIRVLVRTVVACPAFPSGDDGAFTRRCVDTQASQLDVIDALAPDAIFVTQWTGSFAAFSQSRWVDSLSEIEAALASRGVGLVWMHDPPTLGSDPVDCLGIRDEIACTPSRFAVAADTAFHADVVERTLSAAATFVDPLDALCDDEGDRVVVPVAMRAFGCSGGSTVGRTRLV